MRLLLLLILLALSPAGHAQPSGIEVQALFTDTVVLNVRGQRKMLRVGETYENITVISADSRQAVLEIDGQRHPVGVSQRIGSDYQAAEKRVVNIRRNQALQYLTRATINGRPVPVLVDTGANVMLLNAQQAESLRIDYRAGQPTRIQTAGGTVEGWMVMLPSVALGGIKVNQVVAAVVPGDQPPIILLGMSFLRHVEIKESDGLMSISSRW